MPSRDAPLLLVALLVPALFLLAAPAAAQEAEQEASAPEAAPSDPAAAGPDAEEAAPEPPPADEPAGVQDPPGQEEPPLSGETREAEAPAGGGTAPAETSPAAPALDPFPSSELLRPRVEFWKKVFGEWSQRQVALHDTEYPELVYELLTFPDTMDTFSPAASQYVRLRERWLEERLRRLERNVVAGAPPEEEEKSLALLITTTAGSQAVLGAHARVRSQRGVREKFLRGLEASGRYLDPFRQIFREAGLPEDLAYLPHVESSFEVRARSSAGAVGLWQFTRSAGRRFMKVGSALDERYDPIAAAQGAARYLRQAYELLGSWALAVTSYNHGMEGMASAKERFGIDFDHIVAEYDGRYFGFSSKNFYAEFLAAREIANDPLAYFPEGFSPQAPPRHDRLVLEQPLAPQRVAQSYGVPLSELVLLNPAWSRRAIHRGLKLPEGTVVWLPEGTLARFAVNRTPSAPPRPTDPARAGDGAPATSSPVSTLGETIVHVVRRGENLFRIAARYGVTVADILGLNALAEPSILKPGQRLLIPTRP